MKISRVQNVVFQSKKSIPWKEVEHYLQKFSGNVYAIKETHEEIYVSRRFPDEYTSSKDSAKLRGMQAKVKANAATIIDELIFNATNRRIIENKEEKHKNDAKYGWHRYDTWFEYPVQADGEKKTRWNLYKGTLIVRNNDYGLILHDIVNIKKEARTPFESK